MDWLAFSGNPLMSVVIGAVLGGLIGFGSSYAILRSQRRDERRAIALGFKKELEIYRDWLGPTAQGFREVIPLEIYLIRDRPINTKNSLYYILRKEMFRLDSKTVDGLLTFYSYLFAAEEARRNAINSWPTETGAIMRQHPFIVELCQPAAESLELAGKMIDDLIRQLKREV